MTVLLAVPIEVGPSLLLKQAARAFTNLFRPYGYDRYSPWELFQAVALWRTDAFPSSHSKDETFLRIFFFACSARAWAAAWWFAAA